MNGITFGRKNVLRAPRVASNWGSSGVRERSDGRTLSDGRLGSIPQKLPREKSDAKAENPVPRRQIYFRPDKGVSKQSTGILWRARSQIKNRPIPQSAPRNSSDNPARFVPGARKSRLKIRNEPEARSWLRVMSTEEKKKLYGTETRAIRCRRQPWGDSEKLARGKRSSVLYRGKHRGRFFPSRTGSSSLNWISNIAETGLFRCAQFRNLVIISHRVNEPSTRFTLINLSKTRVTLSVASGYVRRISLRTKSVHSSVNFTEL